jgi:hypothetical protein
MADLEALARREGETWARNRLEQLRMLEHAIPKAWPGLIAVAYMVAEDLADNGVIASYEVRRLAERINDHAAMTWSVISRQLA